MNPDPRVAFFDGIADLWDGWEDQTAVFQRLVGGLEKLAVGPEETVLDVGCGTGNLTRALLARLSPAGRVVALDISPRMIEAARRKVADERAVWYLADVRRVPLADGACDRAICYSVWPHFEEPGTAARELHRMLRPGGRLHVWHTISRERVNEIHAGAGEAVRGDRLAPAAEVAELLARAAGFRVLGAAEDSENYLVSVEKAPP